MTDQKPFYEIPKEKKTYVVMIAEKTEEQESECNHSIPLYNKAGQKVAALKCDTDFGEIYECGCCGKQTCEFEHMSNTSIHGDLVCKTCARLPKGIMEAAIKLREELNS
jgi:hypothetical protein